MLPQCLYMHCNLRANRQAHYVRYRCIHARSLSPTCRDICMQSKSVPANPKPGMQTNSIRIKLPEKIRQSFDSTMVISTNKLHAHDKSNHTCIKPHSNAYINHCCVTCKSAQIEHHNKTYMSRRNTKHDAMLYCPCLNVTPHVNQPQMVYAAMAPQ